MQLQKQEYSFQQFGWTDSGKGSLLKPKVIAVGDSFLNGIHEKGLCKDCDAKVKRIPGGTGETLLNETDRLVV